jgi:hypothetical protein
MRVQACPSCGARYNVSRLEDGAVFACRRCQAEVAVGAARVAAPARRGPSYALVFAGLLMIAATFLKANPSFGDIPQWPWEAFARIPSWLLRVTFLCWNVAGIWALLSGLLPGGRFRGGLGIVLLAGLALLCTNPLAGFRIDTMRLPQLLAMVAMGAGVLLLEAEGTRRAGKLLAILGGVVLLLWPVTHFPPGETVPEMKILADDVIAGIQGNPLSSHSPEYVWQTLIPLCAVGVAGLLSILGALGLRWPAYGISMFLLLLTTILLPSAVTLAKNLDAMSERLLTERLIDVLIAHALALFVLGTATVVDLVRSAAPAPGAP